MLQLQRISDGVVFNVLGTKTEPSPVDVVFLAYAEGGLAGWWFGFGRAVLEEQFIAYPPQPDRVDQLMQETDGWEPLQAYRIAFCPADGKPLESGHRVVEAYAGALVDAGKCPACGRFFADDTLTEIKPWKD